MLFKLMILMLYNPFFQKTEYCLLELTIAGDSPSSKRSSSSGQIRIHQATRNTLTDAKSQHFYKGTAVEEWEHEPGLRGPWEKVEKVIKNYNNEDYYAVGRNCRTFICDVGKACGAKVKCIMNFLKTGM